jgi:hypothetical protein
MPTARAYAGAAVAESNVYVVGGYDGANVLGANEGYNPSKEDQGQAPWRTYQALPSPRAMGGVTALVNLVHVVGGEGPSSVPLKYSTLTDSWEDFEQASEERPKWRGLGLVALGTKIHALGGMNGQYLSSNLEYQAIYTISIAPGNVR